MGRWDGTDANEIPQGGGGGHPQYALHIIPPPLYIYQTSVPVLRPKIQNLKVGDFRFENASESRLQPGRAWNLRRRSSPWRSRPPRPLGASELLLMSPRYSSVPLRCHLRAGGNCGDDIGRDFFGFSWNFQ